FAIMPIFLYEQYRDGTPGVGWTKWVSFGARPQVFFNEVFSVAVEAGFDHTTAGDGSYEGWLRKITVAPQIGAGRKFFDRPVLRGLVIYAGGWDGSRGLVGGDAFRDDTKALTAGVQAEHWW